MICLVVMTAWLLLLTAYALWVTRSSLGLRMEFGLRRNDRAREALALTEGNASQELG
jgi:hypothetical protein